MQCTKQYHVPTVEPIGVIVSLASLPCTEVPQALFYLLQLMLFRGREEDDGDDCFTSISVVEGSSITIVAEAAALAGLRENVPALVHDEVEWAVVRVAEGSAGYESVGVVERLTEPLALQGIPVLYQSTYSMDYCLIPQDRLEEAMAVLERHSQLPSGPLPDLSANTGAEPEDSLARSASAAAGLGRDSSTSAHHTYPLTVMDRAMTQVMRLEKQHRHRHTGALLRLLFMPYEGDAPQAIASLTETADEISLVVCNAGWWAAYCADSPEAGLHHDPHQGWVPIRVGDESGTPLEETGVIASQAKVLADANLSILYLSTFWSDFTLVQKADLADAVSAFEKSGFRVSRVSEQAERLAAAAS